MKLKHNKILLKPLLLAHPYSNSAKDNRKNLFFLFKYQKEIIALKLKMIKRKQLANNLEF